MIPPSVRPRRDSRHRNYWDASDLQRRQCATCPACSDPDCRYPAPQARSRFAPTWSKARSHSQAAQATPRSPAPPAPASRASSADSSSSRLRTPRRPPQVARCSRRRRPTSLPMSSSAGSRWYSRAASTRLASHSWCATRGSGPLLSATRRVRVPCGSPTALAAEKQRLRSAVQGREDPLLFDAALSSARGDKKAWLVRPLPAASAGALADIGCNRDRRKPCCGFCCFPSRRGFSRRAARCLCRGTALAPSWTQRRPRRLQRRAAVAFSSHITRRKGLRFVNWSRLT